MNTIFAQIEDCCYILARKGKTIWLLVCDDLTLITWNLYYELLLTVGIKEKERSTVEESYYYYWEVSSKKI